MALKTITNPGIKKQTHVVDIPPLCPRTHNPVAGSTLTISYTPANDLLEVYSLQDYVASFAGSETVRDVEQLVIVAARDCREALGVGVFVTGKFVLNISQTVICEYQEWQ